MYIWVYTLSLKIAVIVSKRAKYTRTSRFFLIMRTSSYVAPFKEYYLVTVNKNMITILCVNMIS